MDKGVFLAWNMNKWRSWQIQFFVLSRLEKQTGRMTFSSTRSVGNMYCENFNKVCTIWYTVCTIWNKGYSIFYDLLSFRNVVSTTFNLLFYW